MEGRRKRRQTATRRDPLLCLRPNAARGGDYIRDYYSYFGPAADDMARATPSSPAAVEELVRGFGDVGADEVVCWPTVADLEQVDRLAEVAA